MRNNSKVFKIFSVTGAGVMLVALFMPLLGAYGYDFNVIPLLDGKGIDNDLIPLAALSLAAAVISTVFNAISFAKTKLAIGGVISSAAGIVFLIVTLSEGLEAMGIGFILYVMAAIAATVFGILALCTDKKTPSGAVMQPGAVTGRGPFCRNCGTRLTEGAQFCANCGTRVNP